MNNITLIAALDKNRGIGKNNELLWKIKEDLQFFKKQTLNKKIIMGMNTFNSLKSPLPNRTHLVLTRQNVYLGENIKIFHTINELLNYINGKNEEFMVIGGSMIYKEMIYYANKMLLTIINETKEADAYFPEFNENEWIKTQLLETQNDGLSYKRIKYTRKEK